MRHEIARIAGTPTKDPLDSIPTASGRSAEWEYVYGDGSIPEPKRNVDPVRSDVMALGDVDRDPTKPIAPYVAPTQPTAGSNPFPMLDGPMG